MRWNDRRRGKQIAHNLEHGIYPMGIIKPIFVVRMDDSKSKKEEKAALAGSAEEHGQDASCSPQQLAKRIQQIENLPMYKHDRSGVWRSRWKYAIELRKFLKKKKKKKKKKNKKKIKKKR